MSWRDRATCKDPALVKLFMATIDTAPNSEYGKVAEQHAKEVCARCPVIEYCLEAALKTGGQGVIGGLSQTERAKLKKKRRLAKAS